MVFTLLSLIVLAVLLATNYAKDKGSHNRAKVLHALALAFAVLMGAVSFGVVASQVQHFTAFAQHYSHAVGWVPGPLNLAAAVLVPVCKTLLFLAAFAATQRNAIAVRIFRGVLLASIPALVIGVYVQTHTSTVTSISLLIATIVMGSIKLGLFFLYGTRFMREFLASRAGAAQGDHSWNEQA